MDITCSIRYQIDPFRHCAENWGRIIPRCGGRLLGYFLPREGTNDIAWGLIGFDSLAAFETYRAALKPDPEGRADFEWAQWHRAAQQEGRSRVFASYRLRGTGVMRDSGLDERAQVPQDSRLALL